jgi:hypothetical protein
VHYPFLVIPGMLLFLEVWHSWMSLILNYVKGTERDWIKMILMYYSKQRNIAWGLQERKCITCFLLPGMFYSLELYMQIIYYLRVWLSWTNQNGDSHGLHFDVDYCFLFFWVLHYSCHVLAVLRMYYMFLPSHTYVLCINWSKPF